MFCLRLYLVRDVHSGTCQEEDHESDDHHRPDVINADLIQLAFCTEDL